MQNQKISGETPIKSGYRMPAEWEPHEATWLSWPHNKETWPQKLKEVQISYIQIIKALLYSEKVNLLINSKKTVNWL